MYIYIHVENFAREFDAKLLLSLLSVKKDIKILLGNVNQIVQKENIPNGIFHNKDITASREIIKMFKRVKKNNIIITSQDEEGGIERKTPVSFVKKRYSHKTLKLVDKVFTFGKFDTDYLKKKYLKFKNKIINTGSPRFDFYKSILEDKNKKKKFILISSNFGTSLERRNFWERIEIEKKAYVEKFNGSDEEKRLFDQFSHNTSKIYYMVQLVRYLTDKYKKEKFIFRPHPIESIEGWKKIIGKRKNLEVLRKGSLVDWIKGAKILIQSGCFSAIEASLAGTNIITFQPFFNQKFDKYFLSSLGFYCKKIDQVDKKLNFFLQKRNKDKIKNINLKNMNKVQKRLNFNKNTLNSYEIVNIWHNFAKNLPVNKQNENLFDKKLYIEMLYFRFKKFIKNFYFFKKDKYMYHDEPDRKFPIIDMDEVYFTKTKIVNKLKLNDKIQIKQINNHLCLIKL